MARAREELTSPEQWLRHLSEENDGYARLVRESGGMARAAYRVAQARCRIKSPSGAPPTLEDLQTAAEQLAARVGRGGALPITSVLASDAERMSLQAMHTALQGSLRSLPPPAPSSPSRQAESRREARNNDARSRPSGVTPQ